MSNVLKPVATTTDRIVLNPHVAKRVINMPEKGLREYENRCGELKL